jgi:hypothetical protein
LSSATLPSTASSAADGVNITAIITDSSNNTVSDAVVTFGASSGALQVVSGTTGDDGTATATLTTAGDPTLRQITVTATSGSVSRTAIVQVVSDTGGATVGSVTLLPLTGSIPSDADTQAEGLALSALVKDSSNVALSGIQVSFAASSGLLQGITATTDGNGLATATLTNGGDPTLRSITVSAGVGSQSSSRTYSVVNPAVGSTVASLRIVSSSNQLLSSASTPGQGVTITAIATDSNNNVVSGVPVSFAASSGALANQSGTTDANGIATAVLTTGGNPALRTITVNASVGTLTTTLSPPIQVVSAAGPQATAINLIPSSASLASNASTQAQGVTLVAVVTDANGVTLAGVPVSFSAPAGAVTITQGTTDGSGQATAVLTTGGNPAPRTIAVTASTGSLTRTVNVSVVTTSGGSTVSTVTLNTSSLQLPSDAATASSPGAVTLTAFVRDAGNNAVQGATVSFSASSGQIAQVQAISDANGQATAVLTTGGDPTLRTITVTAASGSAPSSSKLIQVVSGATGAAVSTVNLVAASPTLQSTASTPAQGVLMTATVLNASNNPVPGVTVTFSTTAGALANISGVTDSNGQAKATLTTGGATIAPGTNITVSAKVGSVTGTRSVLVVAAGNQVSEVVLLSSSPQLSSAASTVAAGLTLTAIVKDANGNLLSGIPVTFAAPTAGVQVTQGTTDATGVAKAVLTTGGNPTNRLVTVTATASGATTVSSAPIQVAVVGTTLQIIGPTSIGFGPPATAYSVLLLDSSGTPIANRTVTVSKTVGSNTLSPASLLTDSLGRASFNFTGGVAGADTLTATSTGVTTTLGVQVVAEQLVFVAPTPAANTQIEFGDVSTLTVQYLVGVTPTSGATLNFATTRGDFDGGTGGNQTTATSPLVVDNADGTYTVSIRSNGTDGAGPALITARVGASGPSVARTFEFIADTPATVDLQASPTTIPLSGVSTLTAVVRDAANNLVANQQVDFSLTDVTGGSLSSATGMTNSSGSVSITYTASNTPSGLNGVSVTAQVNSTAISDTATLTVGGQALFISLGTGNQITEPTTTTYQAPFSAVVSDAAGNPAPPNTVFRLSVISLAYQKGAYLTCAGTWVQSYTIPAPGLTSSFGSGCASEDQPTGFGNGILDPGEDTNINGTMEPGNVVTVPATVALDSDGVAEFFLTYAQDRAYWIKVRLRATASVAGSESVTETDFVLPGIASDFNDCDVSPPGQVSPYGTGSSCASAAPAQCSDGIDNEGIPDGFIDQADPDCTDPLDDDESL